MHDNNFVMYYTATEIQTGDQCIGVATSALPMGPYTDNESQPMVCQNGTGYSHPTVDSAQDLGGSIDPDIFTDAATGDSYLIWKMQTVITWSIHPISPSMAGPYRLWSRSTAPRATTVRPSGS